MKVQNTTRIWYLPVLLVITAVFIFIGLKFIKTDSTGKEAISDPAAPSSAEELPAKSELKQVEMPADQADYLKAGAYLDKGDYQNAIKSLEAAIAKNPNNINYYSLKAQAELLAGNNDAAQQTLQSGLKIDPNNELLKSKIDVLSNDQNLAPADQESPRL